MSTHLAFETPLLLIGAFGVVVGALFLLRVWHATKGRHDKWQPALGTKKDLHVLGSKYPQDNRDFLSGMVNNSYTVPKDPIEYAKIFVPETKDKGQKP